MRKISSNDLKRKISKTFTWSMIDVLLKQASLFGTSILVARYLGPESYGLISVILLLGSLVYIISDHGLSYAIQRVEHINGDMLITADRLILVISSTCVFVLWVLSDLISSILRLPEFGYYFEIVSIPIALAPSVIVYTAYGYRNLEVKRIVYFETVAILLGCIAAIYGAVSGWGVKSLLLQYSVQNLALVIIFKLNITLPKGEFDIKSIRDLQGFGLYMCISALIETLFSKAYTGALGNKLTLSEVGFYNRAESTSQYFNGILAGAVGKFIFPALARMNESELLNKNNLLRLLLITSMAGSIIMSFVVINSTEIVGILYGENWKGLDVYVSIVAAGLIFNLLNIAQVNIVSSIGGSSFFLRIEIQKKILAVLCLGFGMASYGLMGVAYGYLAANYAGTVINMIEVSTHSQVRKFEIFKIVILGLIPAFSSALLSILILNSLGSVNQIESLIVSIGVYILLFGIFIWIVFKNQLLFIIKNL